MTSLRCIDCHSLDQFKTLEGTFRHHMVVEVSLFLYLYRHGILCNSFDVTAFRWEDGVTNNGCWLQINIYCDSLQLWKVKLTIMENEKMPIIKNQKMTVEEIISITGLPHQIVVELHINQYRLIDGIHSWSDEYPPQNTPLERDIHDFARILAYEQMKNPSEIEKAFKDKFQEYNLEVSSKKVTPILHYRNKA